MTGPAAAPAGGPKTPKGLRKGPTEEELAAQLHDAVEAVANPPAGRAGDVVSAVDHARATTPTEIADSTVGDAERRGSRTARTPAEIRLDRR